ncbi:hypothetical protein [Trinickia caryophylli]|uniref:Uncharacterized protein n=2 Tax=Trinickia caryophylli TaxID=28094 RepID=A0A1X7DXG8_TRICW|nr:hypothetical protein [Trinickia caryophylli]WQE11344.1 hypothetical protein U0034_16555 [Trinickia caryophylli]SMF23427.1 hypothetical protein SAMN06295900_104191 [Trinickia caryophylli]
MAFGIGKTLTAALLFGCCALSLAAPPQAPGQGGVAGPPHGEAGRPGPGLQGGAMQRAPGVGAPQPSPAPPAMSPATPRPQPGVAPGVSPGIAPRPPGAGPRQPAGVPHQPPVAPHQPGNFVSPPGRPAAAPWHGDIGRFGEHDIRVWQSGRWHHGPHRGRPGWWWIVGGVWYFYPGPVYPYPDPYVPPYVVAPPPGVTYWYYCPYYGQYYPYGATCPGGWQAIAAMR